MTEGMRKMLTDLYKAKGQSAEEQCEPNIR
jgi:hypothetical protein